MIKKEKLKYLQSHHMEEWIETRQKVENELSSAQTLLCVCGRLATGQHERHCKKFQNKVQTETIKRLNHLIQLRKEKKNEQKICFVKT